MSSETDVLEQEFDMLIVVWQSVCAESYGYNDASDEYLKSE
jgi:hypothetical protein